MHYAPSGDTRLVSRCVGFAPTKKPPLYRQGPPPGTTIRMASGWHLALRLLGSYSFVYIID